MPHSCKEEDMPQYQLSDAARRLWRELVEEWEMRQYGALDHDDETWPECETETLTDLRNAVLTAYREDEDEQTEPLLALEEAARGDVRAIIALRSYWRLPPIEGPAVVLREMSREATRREIGEE